MKKIFCPKCDGEIIISDKRLDDFKSSGEERMAIVCNHCTHQLRIRMKQPAPSTKEQDNNSEPNYGHIVVLENVFGYKQYFPLRFGLNHIGRRNKDTTTDIPIITGDPSMDRHHAIIRISKTKKGGLIYALGDHDSRVGTFLADRILEPKEWAYLEDGDVFTLGATTIIFSRDPLPVEQTDLSTEAQ